jgi:energy-converting hydrogenase A subunit M
MKVNEVPQDDVPDYSEGIKKGNYALDDEGKYVMVPSKGWVVDEMINRMAYDEYKAKEEEIRKAVLAGQKSPLAYYMELRQMTPEILGKTAGIAAFRVKRHLRPEIFAKLKPDILDSYAKALDITTEELKTVPKNPRER